MNRISFDFLSVHRKSCCVISKMKNPHHKISLKPHEWKIHAATKIFLIYGAQKLAQRFSCVKKQTKVTLRCCFLCCQYNYCRFSLSVSVFLFFFLESFFGMGNIWTRHLPSLLSPTQTSDHCEALNSRFANRADRVDLPPTGGWSTSGCV